MRKVRFSSIILVVIVIAVGVGACASGGLSGTYVNMSNDESTITFNKNGTFTTSGSGVFYSIIKSGKFEVAGDENLY